MGNNINRWLLVIFFAQLVLSACDHKKNESLGKELLKPIPSNFQTVTEAPAKDSQPLIVDVEDDDKQRSNTTLGEDYTGATTSTGQPLTPWGQGAGVVGHPGGAPPVPPIPPPATDDDLFEDDLLIDGPGAPYGLCGNSIRELNEHCDDGNQDNTDGCNILCQFPFCGNGVTEKGEECDDNNVEDADGCSACCLFERCGNSRLDPGEQCDDGNKDTGDGCSPCCLYERCGNSIIDPREQCDDGNVNNGDGCDDCCKTEAAPEAKK